MPTGADSDPKQLLTYSPNFSFRSSLLLAKRIVYETGPCIASPIRRNSGDIGLHPDNITHVVPLRTASDQLHTDALRSETVCPDFSKHALIVRIAVG